MKRPQVCFVTALAILLANDLYFKYVYHNWITGKLSDFAGLFVFVVFWTALFPKWKNFIYVATALIFIYWKSNFSQGFIDLFSPYVFSIERTVDFTDLLALSVLPLAYLLEPVESFKLTSVPLALLTLFSFCATSAPRYVQSFDPPEYILFKPYNIDLDMDFRDEIQTYDFDSMMVVTVSVIEIGKRLPYHDDVNKAIVLKDLDLRVLKGNRGLRDSLMIKGNTVINLVLDSVIEELHFNGTRLHGPYKRYSKKDNRLLFEDRYENGISKSLRSEKDVAVTNQYLRIAFTAITGLACLFILIRNRKKPVIKYSTFTQLSQLFLLPTVVTILEKVILSSWFDLFAIFGYLFYANLILIPTFAAIHFWIKLRTRYDILLYVLLLTAIWLLFDEIQLIPPAI